MQQLEGKKKKKKVWIGLLNFDRQSQTLVTMQQLKIIIGGLVD
jgi:hypothetical protein